MGSASGKMDAKQGQQGPGYTDIGRAHSTPTLGGFWC